MNAKSAKKELLNLSTKERKKTNEWFFQTKKGDYGEGDIFIGCTVPNIRKTATKYKKLPLSEVQILISSKIHEERLCALVILVENIKIADKNKDLTVQKNISKFYLKNIKFVNNWDLVDTSCHYILGKSILNKALKEDVLFEFAMSKNLWKKRISMVSTFAFIRANKFDTTMLLADILVEDSHDLIQKAVGWMLREIWKKDSFLVENFLQINYSRISRTTLGYAIEKVDSDKRKKILKGNFNFLRII